MILIAAAIIASLSFYLTVGSDESPPIDASLPAVAEVVTPVAAEDVSELPPEVEPEEVGSVNPDAEPADEPPATVVEAQAAPAVVAPTVRVVVEPEVVLAPVEAEPEPEPVQVVVPTVVLDPVSYRINTIPPSTISIDGAAAGSTYWSGELTPGNHSLRMTSNDGRVQQTTITVSANNNSPFCWQFDLEGPCPR